MKKAFLTTVGLVALGVAPAVAADLPARTYTKAPVAVAAINNWTGFYVGAMGGYAKENTSFAPVGGGFAGGTLGYNFQSGAVVFGIETDAAWSDISATIGAPGVATLSTKFEEIGTVRGRIGYAFDQVLVYGTGGYAWANNKVTATLGPLAASDTRFLSGWTAGGGVEVMFAPKWSVKAEYLYRSLEGGTYGAGALTLGTFNVNSVQAGINYHF